VSDEITEFRIEIPDDELAGLRRRLHDARWFGPEPVNDWSQGVPLSYLQELCRHWADDYDWRATETRLNRLPQYRTEIDGLVIHFIHVRSPHRRAMPLIITHGWPGSVVEFGKVIGPLADPPAHSAEEDSGYSKEQATRPQTIGYALVDSPVALCAWIIEKSRAWTDSDGHPEYVPTRDELLDHVMLYWLPRCGASAARLYWESIDQMNRWITGPVSDTVTVPVRCSIFPAELQRPSRRRAEKRFVDIRYWNEPARAATSPHSSSRSCSPMRFARSSASSGNRPPKPSRAARGGGDRPSRLL
jgi:Epoxide hydrolase N terminus